MIGYIIALIIQANTLTIDLPDYASAALCPLDQTTCGYISGAGWGYITCPNDPTMDCARDEFNSFDTLVRMKLGAWCSHYDDCQNEPCRQNIRDQWCSDLEDLLDQLAADVQDCGCTLTTVIS